MRERLFKGRELAILGIVIAVLAFAGCKSKGSIAPLTDKEIKDATNASRETSGTLEPKKTDMWGDTSLKPKEKEKLKIEIEKAFLKAVQAWLTAKDKKEFEKGMTGPALKELVEQTKKERAEGKIKIRVHESTKMVLGQLGVEKSVIAYKYVDKSYYVDLKTRKRLGEPPLNQKKEWLVAIVKKGKTWKISEIVPFKPKQGSKPADHPQ